MEKVFKNGKVVARFYATKQELEKECFKWEPTAGLVIEFIAKLTNGKTKLKDAIIHEDTYNNGWGYYAQHLIIDDNGNIVNTPFNVRHILSIFNNFCINEYKIGICTTHDDYGKEHYNCWGLVDMDDDDYVSLYYLVSAFIYDINMDDIRLAVNYISKDRRCMDMDCYGECKFYN